MLPWGDIDCAKVEQVGIGVVVVDFEHFGDKPAARPTLDLDDDIKRIRNVGLDGAVRNLDATLQNAARKARKPLFRGAGVNGRNGSRVAGVQKLKEIERFPGANLAEQNTIRAVAHSGFQEV